MILRDSFPVFSSDRSVADEHGEEMIPVTDPNCIIGPDDLILITGAGGFIGPAVVRSLLNLGYRNLRALVRESSNVTRLEAVIRECQNGARVEIQKGNLLSREDCARAARDVSLILHLATGVGKSFPDAFMNSVVATRNLLDASLEYAHLRRFVNVSSFAVYSNTGKSRWRLLDEASPIEKQAARRGEAYCFAKIRQDEIVAEYSSKFGIPYVIVRPGAVYGPGKTSITGRVGIDSFGLFLHMGGSNAIPLTYVDNCADAIALAGLKKGLEGEIFNVVDDDLPSSRRFLRLYKRNVRRFASLYVPHAVSYVLCCLWEKYSAWSDGQLPPAFNRSRWHAEWKKTHYSNQKLKARLGWEPRVSMSEGLARYFRNCREQRHA
ncbi:MAG: NAD(P)-dependent oxidoreductase [Candidatus Acidiferrales bacterium]